MLLTKPLRPLALHKNFQTIRLYCFSQYQKYLCKLVSLWTCPLVISIIFFYRHVEESTNLCRRNFKRIYIACLHIILSDPITHYLCCHRVKRSLIHIFPAILFSKHCSRYYNCGFLLSIDNSD